jgi:polyketide synthase PksL
MTAVAIIGIAVRFPQADDPGQFWEHLATGRCLIGTLPAGRRGPGTEGLRAATIDDVEGFDAAFFRVSPREAEMMDPQQRIALELAWKAIEDGGYRPGALAGANVGVFMGVGASDYAELTARHQAHSDAYMPTGTSHSIVANRVSHLLDLRGPSLAVDTACSSSLTAVQQAVLALEHGECSMALAGAVNLCLSASRFTAFRKSGQLSRDGASRAFDAAAAGFVRGEGGAVLVLKPLADAVAHGDPIHGVIRAVSTRHGGKTHSLTAVTPTTQEALIVDVYTRAGIDPDTVDYLEAHAQGALLGDPIEIQGLKRAFARLGATRPCGVGSVKGNVGHLEAAAGMAGIVKVLQAMRHRMLPATCGFETLNPLIQLEGSPFYVVGAAREWPSPGRAGVSTIGFGGVSGHVVLEPPPAPAGDPGGPGHPGPHVVPLSARTGEALRAYARAVLASLQAGTDLASLAHTLQTARDAMEERAAFVAETSEELRARIEDFLRDGTGTRAAAGAPFLDPGEARLLTAHWVEQGRADRLARAWSHGLDVDWALLYGDTKPVRIHCATYPFTRTPYWLPTGADPAERGAPAPARASAPAPALDSNPASVRGLVVRTLAAKLGLGAGAIDPEAAFADYGLDSISAAGVVQTLNEHLGTDLSTTSLFAHASVDRLTRHLEAGQPRPFPSPPPSPETGAAGGAGPSPIAVVGMSGRFARSDNVEQLWGHLARGAELVGEVSRWPPRPQWQCSRGGFLSDIDRFDAPFFRIAGAEATAMDPQQRIFLEEAWHALEDAGHAGRAIEGSRCGVYVGSQGTDYGALFGAEAPAQAFWGTSDAVIAARIAYFLDLQGPAVGVDTACSSSLVAIHLACQALWSGEVDMALAGGVFVQSTPSFYDAVNRAGMVSPTGHCYAFDARADGFVPGEGAGVVVLRRLADALADGDAVHAVIRGSGINQDGRTNGLAAPSAQSQERLEREVYDRFGIDPAGIQMVEAHGTGTILGDPIELEALTGAFRRSTDRTRYCALGSVKANIGHTTTAAGVAGVLKVLLALRHGQIPPAPHWERANPAIPLDDSPFYVNTTLIPWEAEGPRRAAVSSFSFCGTNAHLVIEEAPAIPRAPRPPRAYPVVLSAQSEAQLQRQIDELRAHVDAHPGLDLGDVSYTLLTGRRQLPHRFACRAETLAELSDALRERRASEAGADEPFGKGYRRVSLPGYPFAGERYWPATAPRGATHYTGSEFFLDGHRIDGRRVLPAAVCPDLVRAALPDPGPLVLRDVVWLRPLVVGEGGTSVRVVLAAPDEFTIEADEPCVRGTVAALSDAPPERADLAALLASCPDGEWTGEECYRRFAALGMEHGPAMRGLSRVHRGPGRAVARVAAASAVAALDCALQVALLLALEAEENATAAPMPFSAEAIELRRAVPGSAWVHVRRRPGRLHVFDIDLHDDDGELCLRMAGLTEKFADGVRPAPRLVYAVPRWERRDVEGRPDPARVHLMLAGLDGAALREVAERTAAAAEPLDTEWMPVIERAQAVLRDRDSGPVRLLVMAPDARFAPLAALFRTARLENPKLRGTVVTIPDLAGWAPEAVARIAAGEHGEDEVRYDASGARYVRRLAEWTPPGGPGTPAAVPGGVYWITGGMGGLGRIVAAHLGKTPGVRLVLTGRSALTSDGSAFLETLRRAGARAEYRQADVTRRADVHRVVAEIRERHGRLDGIVHAAGVLRDAWLLKDTRDAMEAVLAPKVDGTTLIDEATRGFGLDFFALFSSVAAVRGSPGQAVYGAANAFLDAFAEQRRGPGRTISINWPLWAQGGMKPPSPRADAEAMATADGLAAFEVALRGFSGARIGVEVGSWRVAAAAPAAPPDAAPVAPRAGGTAADALPLVRSLFAEAAGIDPARLRADVRLDEYGLDSILAVSVTQRLEKEFGPLPKTLFFEHVDLDGVAEFLAREGRVAVSRAPVEASPVEASPVEASPVEASPVVEGSPAADASPAVAVSRAPAPPPGSRDVAIVGLSGRYPHAENLDELWRLLDEGRDAFEPPPSDRWDPRALYAPTRDVLGKSTIRTGTFLRGIDRFDPRYFSISQHDAELMSPEARLLLQVGVQALEDAGYSRETLQRRYRGNVGVLVGTMNNHYLLYGFQSLLRRGARASGTLAGAIPNLLSYFYGFSGPSLFVDAMCASSLVAIHQAVQMLRGGECPMVVVGSVNLMLHPYNLVATSQEHYTTTTGEKIRSYGLGADGTIVGEGAGALVLKRLADAERDGDHVYGVIRGSAVTNAGVRNGFTVPNPHMQALAIEKALADAGVDPRSISCFEGHGSGTRLGDPIEIKGATLAFEKWTSERGFCPVGSVKSNLGHLLAAAGLAGVTKVLLQMKHRRLVASVNAEELNPAIPFAESPFFVQRTGAEWVPPAGAPRRAGVTSIGAGGMNAHLVIDEYEAPPPAAAARGGPHLMVFSAMNPRRMTAWLERMRAFLDAHPDVDLRSLAYTLQAGRNALPCRLAFVAADLAGVRRRLTDRAGLPFTENVALEAAAYDAAEVSAAAGRGDLEAVARYWIAGAAIDWDALHPGAQPRRLSLPAYPFEETRCWYPELPDAPSLLDPIGFAAKLHPFVGRNESGLAGVRFTLDVHPDELLDYHHEGEIVGTFVLDAALAVARLAGVEGPLELRDVHWLAPIEWTTATRLLYRLESRGNERWSLAVSTGVEAIRLELARPGSAPVSPVPAGRRWDVAEPPFQQDHFKRNVTLPAPLLVVIAQSAGPLRSIGRLRLLRPAAETRSVVLDGDEMALVGADGEIVGHLSGIRRAGSAAGGSASPATGAGPSVEQVLKVQVAAIAKFSVDQIDHRTPIQSYGLDSIALTTLAGRVNDAFGVALTPAVFFEHPNVESLAGHQRGVRQPERPAPIAAAAPRAAVRREGAVAIVGMAGRFPQADSIEELWDHLVAGRDLITPFPRERYDAFYRDIVDRADFPKYAGVVRDVDAFDAAFFRISRLEAELMDPRHRLALETVWHALEDSGHPPSRLPESTAVFFGISGSDYANLLSVHGVPADAFIATGNEHSMLANRISFLLDIHGPSQPVDTACSSSLVAIHRAVETLRSGRSAMAIAGGVNLLLSVDTSAAAQMAGMLSPDGRCRTFSRDAGGYVRAEGVVALVLKPLADAERDGDRIHGVILASAENHGGRAGSLTAPNVKAQARLIEAAMSGIDPATIGYVEAHGTGTPLGDPAEVSALRRAYAALPAEGPVRCALGSLKTNIGHLEAAAGAAGVVKALLAMRHGELPATLHCGELNPHLELEGSPFWVVRERTPWPRRADAPRRAAVSSFGFGGANAHVVLEEYPAPAPAERAYGDAAELFVLSARDEAQLRRLAAGLADCAAPLPAIAWTLQAGREPMEARFAFRAAGRSAFRDGLAACASGPRPAPVPEDPVLARWMSGADVDWASLWTGGHPVMAALPPYPFARERYWIPRPEAPSLDEAAYVRELEMLLEGGRP